MNHSPVSSKGSAPQTHSHCPVCGNALLAETIWCVECGTPHHRDCFAYNGRCAIYGCTGMHYVVDRVTGQAVTWVEIRTPEGALVPQGYVVDFSSNREQVLSGVAMFALCCAVVGALCSLPLMLAALGITATAALVRLGLDDYRIVDSRTRTIWLHRKFLRFRSVTPETSFDLAKHLLVRGRRIIRADDKGSWAHQWAVVLVLKNGGRMELTDVQTIPDHDAPRGPEIPPEDLTATARKLSTLMEIDWRIHLE